MPGHGWVGIAVGRDDDLVGADAAATKVDYEFPGRTVDPGDGRMGPQGDVLLSAGVEQSPMVAGRMKRAGSLDVHAAVVVIGIDEFPLALARDRFGARVAPLVQIFDLRALRGERRGNVCPHEAAPRFVTAGNSFALDDLFQMGVGVRRVFEQAAPGGLAQVPCEIFAFSHVDPA